MAEQGHLVGGRFFVRAILLGGRLLGEISGLQIIKLFTSNSNICNLYSNGEIKYLTNIQCCYNINY